MRIEREHEFDVPLAAGFEYVTNLANWPSYWPNIVRVEPGSRWAVPGDEARIVVKLLGRKVELRMTLRRFEPRRPGRRLRARPRRRHSVLKRRQPICTPPEWGKGC